MAGFRTVIINKMAKLETKLGYLIIRDDKEERIHLSEIETLIVESTAVSLTAMLLSELSKNGVGVVFCSEKHLPEGLLLPIYGNFAVSKKLNEQIGWNKSKCKVAWQLIIKQKIAMQARLLYKTNRDNEAKMLMAYEKDVRVNDLTNREGHAAKVYFNCIFGQDFERRTDININSALNYGYAILLANFSREIVSAGYLTQLGIWHRGEQNPYNLSCDLMESFRPIIDELVLVFNEEELKNFKVNMQRLFNAKIRINGEWQYLSAAIRIYIRRVFRFLDENIDSLYSIEQIILE